MTLTEFKCKNCGSRDLDIDLEKHMCYCKYCDTIYSIDNYEGGNNIAITNKISINIIYTANENPSVDKLIKNANEYLNYFKDYEMAREMFSKVIFEAPKDYRGWWGLVKVDNYNLDAAAAFENGVDPYDYEEESKHFEYAMKVASKSVAEKLQEFWDEYLQSFDNYIFEELQGMVNDLNDQISELKHQIKKERKKYCDNNAKMVAIALLCVALIILAVSKDSEKAFYPISLLMLVGLMLIVPLYNGILYISGTDYDKLQDFIKEKMVKIKKLKEQRDRIQKEINDYFEN